MSNKSNRSGYGLFSGMSKEEFLSFLDGYDVSYTIGGEKTGIILKDEPTGSDEEFFSILLPPFEEVVMSSPAALKIEDEQTNYQTSHAALFAA